MGGKLSFDLKNQYIKLESTLVKVHHAILSKNVDVQSISGACYSILIEHYLQGENNIDIKI